MNTQPLFPLNRHIMLCFVAFMVFIGSGCTTFHALNQAEVLFNQGDFALADQSFSQVIEAEKVTNYELQRAYLLRGETRLKLGYGQKALDDIQASIDIFPNTKGFYLRGLAKQKIGDFNEATADFNQVIQIYNQESLQLRIANMDVNNRPEPWAKPETTHLAGKSSIALAEIYLYQEHYPATMEHFNAAAMLIPTDPLVFLKRSGAFQLFEKKDLATKDFQHFLELGGDPASRPEIIMAPLLLKNSLAQYTSKHYMDALDLANQALALHPRYVGALMCRGHSYAKLGKHTEAVNDFSSVILEEPMNIEAYIYRAFSLNELGKYDEAKQDTSFILSHDPKNQHALFHRGFSHLGKKAYEAAAADFSQILEVDPKQERALISRGIALYQVKNLEEARADFQAVINHSPSHQRAHYLLALTLYREKNHIAALNILINAIKLDQGNGKLHHMRGLIYFQLDQKKFALADFEKAVALEPKNGKLHLSLGMAKSSLGISASEDYALARKFFMQERNRTMEAEDVLEPKMEPLSVVIE